MERDLHHNVKAVVGLEPAAIAADTTTVGEIIDSLDHESMEWLVYSGTITDGAYALVLEEGDDPALADAAPVPAENVLGDLTGFVDTDDNAVKRVGSVGKKRYQRLSVVSTGVTTGVDVMGATVAQGHPKRTVAD